MPEFTCSECGAVFSLPESVLANYPNWVPKYCRKHSPKNKSTAQAGSKMKTESKKSWPNKAKNEENLTLAEVLERYNDGPVDGIFTDGSSRPNPGPGGWGVVWVKNNEIVKQLHGQDAQTTNNRMELTALINAYQLLDADSNETIYTDSELCVNTLTKWAKSWQARGWTKKSGEIKNLELVQELYELYLHHPKVKLIWLKAHNGWRWNEYADSLACAWSRLNL